MAVPTSPHGGVAEGVVHAIKWQTASRYMMVEAFVETDEGKTAPILNSSIQAV